MAFHLNRLTTSSVLALLATAALSAAPPMPPLKPGLWETKSTVLDANGKETAPPELAALERMPPEARARMMEMMKGRGMAMPDASGAVKVCLSKELLSADGFEQMSNTSGCTNTYSTQTTSNWKWHSTCPAMKTEMDGDAQFLSPESYKSTLKSTVNRNGQSITQTRVITSKWLSADCGDVKPVNPGRIPNGPPAR